jgi:hypothetical protein
MTPCVTPRGCINEALSYTHSYAHAIVCNRDPKLGATGSRRTKSISPFFLELNQVLSHLKVKLINDAVFHVFQGSII